MTAHAVLSPSSAHRWLACPGSIQANKNKPWEQSVYALEGTTAHALLELCLRLDEDPQQFEGQVLQKGHMAITEEMGEAVGYALDYVRAYLADNPKTEIQIETPVYPGALLGVKDGVIWGTPDVRLMNYPKELVTIDYKHGVGKAVAVKDNSQIKLYHAGGRVERGAYRKYRSVVIQPRLPRRRPVQEATLTDKELIGWLESTVKPIIPIALSNEAPRNPGDWCHYCHASGNCEAQIEKVYEMASKEFAKVAQDPKGLSAAKLSIYLDQVKMMETAINDLKVHATHLLHSGVKIPGYLPSWTAARREWVDEEKTVKVLKKKGLTPAELYDVKLLSPAAMDKVLLEKGIIKRKKRGQEAEPSVMDTLIGYKDQNRTYVKE